MTEVRKRRGRAKLPEGMKLSRLVVAKLQPDVVAKLHRISDPANVSYHVRKAIDLYLTMIGAGVDVSAYFKAISGEGVKA